MGMSNTKHGGWRKIKSTTNRSEGSSQFNQSSSTQPLCSTASVVRELSEAVAQLNSNLTALNSKVNSNIHSVTPLNRSPVAQSNSYTGAPFSIDNSYVYSSPIQDSFYDRGFVQYEEVENGNGSGSHPRCKPPTDYNRKANSENDEGYLNASNIPQLPESGEAGERPVYSVPKSDSKPKMRAERNYEAAYESDMSFKKGDILQLVRNEEVEGWYFVKSLTTGKQGYVHKDYVSKITSVDIKSLRCYFKDTNRAGAEVKLRESGLDIGTYLLRRSGEREYALSLRCAGKSVEPQIKHFKIRVYKDGMCCILFTSEWKPFGNIMDLIRYYTNSSDLQCKLKEPLPREITLDDLDVKFADISINKKERLGIGNFATVYAGTLHGTKSVAVKILRTAAADSITVEQFRLEAETMHKLRHPNLISLEAVCEGRNEYYIITEMMSKGNLLTVLRKDAGNRITFKELIEMAIQITEGMDYMGIEGFVHRDLRAANVLVGDGNIAKIADFGLARALDYYGENGEENYYHQKDETAFPVRWTAPEAFRSQKFTVKSDVWSFGILLYEIITHGGEPYGEMSNHEVLDWVEKGNRLTRPTDCPLVLHSIMKQCWLKYPKERPQFESIKADLIEINNS